MFKVTGVFSFFCLFISQSVASTAAAQTIDLLNPEQAYGQSVRYKIYRKGKPVGEHSLKFSRDANKLTVSVESNIVVTVLKVPVFRFSYRSDEQWQQGKLVSVNSVIKENNKTKLASLNSTADSQMLVDINGKTYRDNLALTSNHWHPGVIKTSKLFNTLTGRANQYQLEEIGEEALNISDTTIITTRYRYSGQLNSDVWYDKRGRWVKLQFAADDGSEIEYQLAKPFDE